MLKIKDNIITQIENPDAVFMDSTLKVWEYEAGKKEPNTFFTFQSLAEVEAIAPERRRFVPSAESDNRIGSHAQYNIGTFEEMPIVEQPAPDPLFEATQKLYADKRFCQGIYDEFLFGNRTNTGMTPEEVITQANNGLVIKVLVDSGAVTSLRVIIETLNDGTLTADQKAYFLGKIDNYLVA